MREKGIASLSLWWFYITDLHLVMSAKIAHCAQFASNAFLLLPTHFDRENLWLWFSRYPIYMRQKEGKKKIFFLLIITFLQIETIYMYTCEKSVYFYIWRKGVYLFLFFYLFQFYPLARVFVVFPIFYPPLLSGAQFK